MLEILGKTEPLWLFGILTIEMLAGLYSAWILTVEYWYDKEFNENIKAARRERRRKRYEFESLTDGEAK